MIHTVLIRHRANIQLYHSFIKLPTSAYYNQYNAHCNVSLREYGISYIKAYIVGKSGYTSPYLEAKINLAHLAGLDGHLVTFSEDMIESASENFNALMDSIATEEEYPTFYDWKLSRVDYCYDIETPHTKTYIKLLKKAYKPHYLQLPKVDRWGRRSHYDTSLYLIGSGQNINFYDKNRQLKDTNRIEDDDNIPENILRLEVQCKYSKARYMKNIFGIPMQNLPYYLSEDLSFYTVNKALDDILKSKFDYIRKSRALFMIDESRHPKKVKKELKMIIKDIGKQHQSIWKVRDRYDEEGIMKKSIFYSRLKMLRDLAINPVTLSDNDRIEGIKKKDGLISLYKLFCYTVGTQEFLVGHKSMYIDRMEIELFGKTLR